MALDFNNDPLPAGNVDSGYVTKIVKVDSTDRPGLSELEFSE